MKQILKSKIVKNSAWLVLLQIVNTIVPMMTIPFVTRKLGSDTYGIFSICLNWILYLQVLDNAWREHLYQMDILKTGIGLRGYNQKDPLVEYKKES